MNMGTITATLRPNTSLSGAQIRGPSPNPKRNKVVPRTATCVPTLNSSATWRVPAEYDDEAQVADMVTRPYSMVVRIFFDMGQLIGLYGSSGPSKSTKLPAAVGTWANGWVKTVGARDRRRPSLLCCREAVAYRLFPVASTAQDPFLDMLRLPVRVA